MNNVLLITLIAMSLLLCLKMAEMVFHIAVIRCLEPRTALIVVVKRWPITDLVLKVRMGWVFRLPTLVLLMTFLLAMAALIGGASQPAWPIDIAIGCLWLSVWVQIAQALYSKVKFGSRDSRFRRLSVRSASKPVRLDRETLLLDAIKFVGGLIFIVIIAYTGIYYSSSVVYTNTFTNLQNVGDALYFSIVTFATVGYGDIQPNGTVARLLCGTQILASICIVGLFVFAHSLAGSPNESTHKPNIRRGGQ